MKFGRNYHRQQLAEWADAYMNYGYLKQLCKASDDQDLNFEGEKQLNIFWALPCLTSSAL
jgi:SPX domain protein involved in polyphosphate accumulation